jgi:hypothetical protein
MAPTLPTSIPVIDFRRQSMFLLWNVFGGTWTACDMPPPLVHGVALILASPPNICLFARAGRLHLQVGSDQYALADDSPRIKWSRSWASFGLRWRFTVEGGAGSVLFSQSYWAGQGDDFFSWLASRAADPEWRAANARRWSEGVKPAVLRSS